MRFLTGLAYEKYRLSRRLGSCLLCAIYGLSCLQYMQPVIAIDEVENPPLPRHWQRNVDQYRYSITRSRRVLHTVQSVRTREVPDDVRCANGRTCI